MIVASATLCYLALAWAPPPGAPEFSRAADIQDYTFERKDDQDLDRQPDDWTRRRGEGFPLYVKSEIDRGVGHNSEQSLKFEANGGAAAYYSPLIRIDPRYTLVLEGYIRTDGLADTAGMVSVSLLDNKRQRVSRHLSAPVVGTRGEWVRIEIGPLLPGPEIRHAIIGCHLLPGEHVEISGGVHFDDLRLGRLPRLSLEQDRLSHFHPENQPLKLLARLSGLDARDQYRLQFELSDPFGEGSQTKEFPLKVTAETAAELQVIEWNLDAQQPGYYRVRAVLHRNGEPLITRDTALAVLQLHDSPSTTGGFGWSLGRHNDIATWEALPELAAQSGINWVKLPVWSSSGGIDPERTTRINRLLDRLTSRGLIAVGVLDEPPKLLLARLGLQDARASEVFTLSREIWGPSLHPVIARYGATVRYWQVGDDADTTLAGVPDLQAVVKQIHREITGVGRSSRLVLPWEQTTPPPVRQSQSLTAVSLTSRGGANIRDIGPSVEAAKKEGYASWVTLWLDQLSGETPQERAAFLVRAMLAARVGGAEAVFAGDVMHSTKGLLTTEGAPTELYLPWRTAALAMQGADYLGEFVFPGESRSAVFARDSEAILFVWASEPTTERLFLGGQPYEVDAWGRRKPLVWDEVSQEFVIPVDESPRLIRGASADLARWRVAAQFAGGKMKSEYGWHPDRITGRNTFPQGVSGRLTVRLPTDWAAEPAEWPLQLPAGEAYDLPVNLLLPTTARMGEVRMVFEFDITADQNYRFKVHQKYQVGLGDVTIDVIDRRLPDGRLEIEQIVKNQTTPPEILDFRCSLFVPGLQRKRFTITKLGTGQDRKLYHLPDADNLRGKELWLRLEQEGGRRILNYRWTVGKDW